MITTIPILVLTACILFLILRDEMRSRTKFRRDIAERDLLLAFSQQLKNNLTINKWYIELLLSRQSGALHISQLEFLKQIEDANESSIELLNKAMGIEVGPAGK
ncbi:MAG: hypothetical protein PHE68_04545 [Candidatus Peribacteraceae bacterium]|nr:hypothetical protein [Candidatus Peribacteraceae bacterium]MDD5074547.1 hypothetical protein [Candidatus Peribacteraceae bacterium]